MSVVTELLQTEIEKPDYTKKLISNKDDLFINPDDIEDTVFTGNLEIEGEKTWFPVDGFFGAPGFGNWQQGCGEKNYKHSKSSVDYVRELGATKAAFEPIKGVRIIVDSSGAAFYSWMAMVRIDCCRRNCVAKI